ncbi:MAG: hypothetical protein HKN82_15510 [Akkermansiaceae bacterium]|nr:hypothetical protein [Akkermansiaceae bacterium]
MACLFLALLPALAAAEEKIKGVDLKLISEVTTVKAGQRFAVGLKIHHHDHYHTYWQKPGIVGVPTDLQWQLPPGFTAGPIQWPYPEKVDMAGHPAHGYHRDVLLIVEIRPPEVIEAEEVTLTARAGWMACAKQCHPGFATFSLQLPVAERVKVNAKTRPLFRKSRGEIPAPVRHWDVTLESAPDAAEIRLRITPRPPHARDPGGFYFYSSDGQVSSDQPQDAERLDDGSYRLTMTRGEFGPKGAGRLPGVLSAARPFDGPHFAHALIDPPYPEKPAGQSP